jgi:hypothetical protein
MKKALVVRNKSVCYIFPRQTAAIRSGVKAILQLKAVYINRWLNMEEGA